MKNHYYHYHYYYYHSPYHYHYHRLKHYIVNNFHNMIIHCNGCQHPIVQFNKENNKWSQFSFVSELIRILLHKLVGKITHHISLGEKLALISTQPSPLSMKIICLTKISLCGNTFLFRVIQAKRSLITSPVENGGI